MNELMKMSSLLCDLDGICGYEDKVRQHIEKEVSPYAQKMMVDDFVGSCHVYIIQDRYDLVTVG